MRAACRPSARPGAVGVVVGVVVGVGVGVGDGDVVIDGGCSRELVADVEAAGRLAADVVGPFGDVSQPAARMAHAKRAVVRHNLPALGSSMVTPNYIWTYYLSFTNAIRRSQRCCSCLLSGTYEPPER